ncbi:hypothetical protein pb186bvf_009388 [Paramecium bursaria]
MYITQETDHNNFIIYEQRQEDIVDFLSQESLSQNGFTLPTLQRRNNNDIDPPPNSKDKYPHFLIPMSPLHTDGPKDIDMLLVKPQTNNQQDQVKKNIPIRNSTTTNVGGSYIKLFHMKRFINRLMKDRINFSKIRESHIDILNDKACSYNNKIFGQKQFNFTPLGLMKQLPKAPSLNDKLKTNLMKVMVNVQTKLQYWDKRIGLIFPESSNKIIWDTILTLIRLYFIILIPIDICFEDLFLYGQYLYFLTMIATVGLIIDQILSLNTAYYQYGQIVTQRTKIFEHVLFKSYGLDSLSIIYLTVLLGINLDPTNDTTSYLLVGLLPFFLQYQHIMKLMRQMEEVLNLNKIAASLLELAKLITLLIYVLHIASCIWFGIGRIGQRQIGVSWLSKYDLIQSDWSEQYLRSFYFSTVTMFTIGYGDMSAQNNLEYFIVILLIMVSSIQLPYSVNTVGTIIDRIQQYNESKQQKLRVINTYMTKKKISYQLQFQIREYLNYFWEIQNVQDSQEENLIVEQLSENLREQLMIEANSMILNECKFFKTQFSDSLKKELVKKIKQQVVKPENIIDYTQDNIIPCLTFVEQGQVEIIARLNQTDTVLGEIQQGGYFGLYEFITGSKVKELYRSVGFTKLLILPRNDFFKIIKDFQEDREKFCQIRDDLVYNQGNDFFKLIEQKCPICGSAEHRLIECYLLTFKPDKERIVKQHQFNTIQVREKFEKRNKDKNIFQTRVDKPIISEAAELIQNDYWKEIQVYDNGDMESNLKQSPQETSSSSERDEVVEDKNFMASKKSISSGLDRNERKSKINMLLLEKRSTRKTSMVPSQGPPRRFNSLQPTILRPDSQQETPQNQLNSDLKETPRNQDNILMVSTVHDFPKIQVQNFQEDYSNQKSKSQTIINDEESDFKESSAEKGLKSVLKTQLTKKALPLLPIHRIQQQEQEFSIQSQSPSVPKDKSKRVKVKFQKAFQFIKRLKDLKKNPNTKQSQHATKSPGRQNTIQSYSSPSNQISQLYQEQQNNLLMIQTRIQRKSRAINITDNQELDRLVLSLNMVINDKFFPIDSFEQQQDFKHYLPHNNLHSMKIVNAVNEKFMTIFGKLVKYFFFPHNYIKKYKQIQPVVDHIFQKRKSATLIKKFHAYKDVMKMKNKARKIIAKRQVLPTGND